jgi:hypothetical protein
LLLVPTRSHGNVVSINPLKKRLWFSPNFPHLIATECSLLGLVSSFSFGNAPFSVTMVRYVTTRMSTTFFLFRCVVPTHPPHYLLARTGDRATCAHSGPRPGQGTRSDRRSESRPGQCLSTHLYSASQEPLRIVRFIHPLLQNQMWHCWTHSRIVSTREDEENVSVVVSVSMDGFKEKNSTSRGRQSNVVDGPFGCSSHSLGRIA